MSKKYFSLSQPQLRIWNTQLIYPDSSMFNIGGVVLIKGNIISDYLITSITKFCSEHDAFQIRFCELGNEPKQYFSTDPINIPYIDFSKNEDPEACLDIWTKQMAETPFSMKNMPLYELVVVKVREDLFGYVVKFHHIIADGWSMQMLTKEIEENYRQQKLCIAPQIAQSEVPQYREYLQNEHEYLLSKRYEDDELFWSDMFKETQLETIYDIKCNDGQRTILQLSATDSENIKIFCSQYNIPVNVFFIGVYILYLSKTTEKEDIIIGTPVLGRLGRKERGIFGMFVSTMATRHFVESQKTILELFHEIIVLTKKCYLHQRYPYNHLVKKLQMYGSQLYNTCVNYYHTELSRKFDGYDVVNTEFYNGQQEYHLQIIIREWIDNIIQLDFDYLLEVYSELDIYMVFQKMQTIMKKIMTDPNQLIGKLNLLNNNEYDILVNVFNNTTKPLSWDETVISLFDKQALQFPERIAIRCNEKCVTYSELKEKSEQLAIHLKEKGVEKNQIVAIIAEHSINTVIGILAILKAGSAFLPLDPQYPHDRISYILADANVNILMTDILLYEDVDFSGEVIKISNAIESMPKGKEYLPEISQDSLIYVIYTSGSTGKPKGVMISHRNLFNYINWGKDIYIGSEPEIFPLYSSLAFDLTMTSIFLPLASGGEIIIYPENENEFVLYRIINDNQCTIMKLTPAHLLLLKDYKNSNTKLKKMIVGGEDLKSKLAFDIHTAFNGDIIIWNEYGPTEATIGCMIYKYNIDDKHAGNSVPIGCPICNTGIYILDSHGNPVPIQQKGELYISGEGLAKGYINNEILTNEKFIHNHITGKNRLYKTGDLAVFLDENTIEYCGRIDSQIKIRGFRVELDEINEVLKKHSCIKESIVLYSKDSNMLYSYYTSETILSEKELQKFLSESLPDYMIPKAFVHMQSIPLTRNGKVDTKRLLAPQLVLAKEEISNEYLDDVILNIIAAVEKVLEKESVKPDDNFYYLGGDSIKAIQIQNHLKNSNVILKMKDILKHPVIREMRNYATNNCISDIVEIKEAEGEIMLTPIIEWYLKQNLPSLPAFSQNITLKLTRDTPLNILNDILSRIVDHHDMLRISYNPEKNTLFYNPEKTIISIQEYNLNDEINVDEIKRNINGMISLYSGEVVKSCIIRNKEVFIWYLVIHHFAVDGVSWRIILDDIDSLLKQYYKNMPYELPQKTHSYKQWAESINIREEGCLNKKFNSNAKKRKSLVNHEIRHLLNDEIKKILRKLGQVSINEALMTGLGMTLANIKLDIPIRIITEKHGRNNLVDFLDISRTVGWFTSIHHLKIQQFYDTPSLMLDEVLRAMQTNDDEDFCFQEQKEEDSVKILFNYLGEFEQTYENFIIDENIEHPNELIFDLEIDCLKINKKLMILLRSNQWLFRDLTLKEFADLLIENINAFILYAASSSFDNSIVDFEVLNLSQDEINSIFG